MSYVQSANQRVASGNNVLAYPSSNAGNNLLLAAVVFEDDTSTVTTLADTRGNTWTQCAAIKRSLLSLGSGQLFYAKNCGAGANTVTLTPSAGATSLALMEYSGYDTSAPLGQHVEVAGTAATADSGNVTTTTTNELLLAVCLSFRTLTAGSGYTSRESFVGTVSVLTEEKVPGAAGPYNATVTLSSSGGYVICLASFILATVVATVNCTPERTLSVEPTSRTIPVASESRTVAVRGR